MTIKQVSCASCGLVLAETGDTPGDTPQPWLARNRQRCPECGSTARSFSVTFEKVSHVGDDDDKYRVNYKGVDYLFNHPRGWDVLSDDWRWNRRWARYVVWRMRDRVPWGRIYGYKRTRRGAEKLARSVTLDQEWWRARIEAKIGRSWPFQFVYVTNLDDRDDAQRARMLARGPMVGPLSMTEADPSLPHSLPQRPKTGILGRDKEEIRRALS